MKRASRTLVASIVLSAAALLLCTACAVPTVPTFFQEDEATPTETQETTTEEAVPEEKTVPSEEAAPEQEGSEILTVVEEEEPAQTEESEQPTVSVEAEEAAAAGTPLLQFTGIEESKTLVSDMDAGTVPVKCNVLYDQMGARPSVMITDPATITEIYELMKDVVVIGKTNMSITDSYHHIFFTLQDGSTVGYSFEGEGILCVGRDNYAVIGTELLWQRVRMLQDEFMQGKLAPQPTTTQQTTTQPQSTTTPSTYAITIDDPSNIITNCPTSAAPGETVRLTTVGVADAELNVYVDEERIHAVDNMGTVWEFTMPEHDVTVRGEEKPVRGGA